MRRNKDGQLFFGLWMWRQWDSWVIFFSWWNWIWHLWLCQSDRITLMSHLVRRSPKHLLTLHLLNSPVTQINIWPQLPKWIQMKKFLISDVTRRSTRHKTEEDKVKRGLPALRFTAVGSAVELERSGAELSYSSSLLASFAFSGPTQFFFTVTVYGSYLDFMYTLVNVFSVTVSIWK